MLKKQQHSRCSICHRRLKDPISRIRGVGPECLKRKQKQSKPIQLEMNFG